MMGDKINKANGDLLSSKFLLFTIETLTNFLEQSVMLSAP